MEKQRTNRLVQAHGPSELYPHSPKSSPRPFSSKGFTLKGDGPCMRVGELAQGLPSRRAAHQTACTAAATRTAGRWGVSCWLLFAAVLTHPRSPQGTWPTPLVSHSPCKSWRAMRGRLDPVKPFFLWEGSWGSKIKRLTQDDFFSGKPGSKRRVPWHLRTKCFSIL